MLSSRHWLHQLALTFYSATAQSANQLEGAITSAAKTGSGALLILTDALFNSQVHQIAQAALKHRLPAVYDRADFVDAGGLMSYGVNLPIYPGAPQNTCISFLKAKSPAI